MIAAVVGRGRCSESITETLGVASIVAIRVLETGSEHATTKDLKFQEEKEEEQLLWVSTPRTSPKNLIE